MAITIEVSRGRYIRHLRDKTGMNQRELMARVNELLPETEQKTHQWFAAIEVDRIGKMPVSMAIALHHVLGADLANLGVSDEEVEAQRRLLALLDEPPAVAQIRGRDRPKSSSRRMTQSRVACPNRSVTLLPSTAAKWRGGPRAYCS